MDVPKKYSPVAAGAFFLASVVCLAILFGSFASPQRFDAIVSSLRLFGFQEPPPQADPCFTANEDGRYPADMYCVLKRAAMENSTVIFSIVNDAWMQPNSLADLFFESLRAGHQTQRFAKHVVLVCIDSNAYRRCLEVHPHCALFTVDGFNFTEEKRFMTTDYLEITFRKIELMRSILELGYSFIFTDIDVMWLRDPTVQLFNTTVDIVSACDHFHGDHASVGNGANTGFSYFRSSNRTIEFCKYWYESRKRFPKEHDQTVFDNIKGDDHVKGLGIKFWFLDTDRFSGFCEHAKGPGVVRTMHANCCGGITNKLHDLRLALEDYRNYTLASAERGNTSRIKWRVPNWC